MKHEKLKQVIATHRLMSFNGVNVSAVTDNAIDAIAEAVEADCKVFSKLSMFCRFGKCSPVGWVCGYSGDRSACIRANRPLVNQDEEGRKVVVK